jgi:hypothetical protein
MHIVGIGAEAIAAKWLYHDFAILKGFEDFFIGQNHGKTRALQQGRTVRKSTPLRGKSVPNFLRAALLKTAQSN